MSLFDRIKSTGLDVLETAIENAFNGSSDLDDIKWYCDDCGAYLNEQPGFDPDCGEWECTECGYENEIDSMAIIDEELHDKIEESGCGSYNEYMELDYCPKCGNGKMIPTGGNWYECDECGFEAEEDPDCGGWIIEDCEDDEYDSDEGCMACGNPAYPDCKSSCSMFDD